MMAAGANVATTLATFSSFAYLFMYYRLKRKEIGNEIQSSTNYKYENVKTIVKNILMVSIPLTLSSIMTSFNKNIDSFTVKRILSTYKWKSRYSNKFTTSHKYSICNSIGTCNISCKSKK